MLVIYISHFYYSFIFTNVIDNVKYKADTNNKNYK